MSTLAATVLLALLLDALLPCEPRDGCRGWVSPWVMRMTHCGSSRDHRVWSIRT
jgi:hypothetical protein